MITTYGNVSLTAALNADATHNDTTAGALNATRRGLATGTRNEIERLAAHVAVRKLDGVDGQQPRETATPDELAARVHAS